MNYHGNHSLSKNTLKYNYYTDYMKLLKTNKYGIVLKFLFPIFTSQYFIFTLLCIIYKKNSKLLLDNFKLSIVYRKCMIC